LLASWLLHIPEPQAATKVLLLLPPVGAVPAAIQDRSGHACLLVLPSDQPSNRKEALAVEELLAQLLQVGAVLPVQEFISADSRHKCCCASDA
jgi:hypothetical protein